MAVDRSRSLAAWILLGLLAVVGCQQSSSVGSQETGSVIAPRILRSAAVTDELWNSAESLVVRFTSTNGRTLLDSTFPFASGPRSTPSVRVAQDEGVTIEVEGLDKQGLVVWKGASTVPAGSASVDAVLRVTIDVGIANGSTLLSGRLEPNTLLVTPGTGGSILVELNNPYRLALIHYTIDGSDPDLESPLYSGPFRMDTLHSLRARAFANRMLPSRLLDTAFGQAGRVEIRPNGGIVDSQGLIEVLGDAADQIRYTFDGSPPLPTSRLYEGPLSPPSLVFTLRARAYRTGLRPGIESQADFSVGLQKVGISIPGGVYDTALSVDLQTPVPGARIHYTTDGRIPSAASPVHSGPLRIDSATTLVAAAYRADLGWGPARTERYEFAVKSMVATTPPPVVFREDRVVVSCPTPGSVIRYTLDGSEVKASSPVYQGPVVLPDDKLGEMVQFRAEASVPGKPGIVPSRLGPVAFRMEWGAMVDTRDGNRYPVVRIGGRVWFARNLDHLPPGSSAARDCLGSDSSACALEGRSYHMEEALGLDSAFRVCQTSPNLRGVCPVGWHVATRNDWNRLISIPKNRSDLLDEPWGSGSLGLALRLVGGQVMWWASTCSSSAYEGFFLARTDTMFTSGPDVNFARKVRCVMDSP